MQVRQSPLFYLLFLCAICSVITQDASSEDTNIQPNALEYLEYLHNKHFEGLWQSTSSAQTFGTFEEHSGFFLSDRLSCEMPVPGFKLYLTVYDGSYAKRDALKISICHEFSPSFHFDSANKSLIGTNIPLKVSGKDMIECMSNITIYFIDRTFEASTVDTQFAISSSECEISLTTGILAHAIFDDDQVLGYISIFGALAILECVCAICLFEKIQAISLVTCAWLVFWRLLLIWINWGYLLNGVTHGAGIILCLIPLIGTVIQLYLMIGGFAEIDDKASLSRDGDIIWTILITIGILLSWNVLNHPWDYFSSCLYLVAQIWANFANEDRFKSKDFLLMLLFMPSLLFHIGYYSMNSDNFARLRPDSDFFWIYVGVFAMQSREKRSRYQIQSNEMAHIESEDSKESPDTAENPVNKL